MRTVFVIGAALLMLPAVAFARNIDISNSPDKSFFLGYERDYDNGCRAYVWWDLRDKYTLIASEKCQRFSDKRLYDDMLTSMKKIRAKSKASSFGRFYDEETENRRLSANSPYARTMPDYSMPSPGYPTQFCINGDKAMYFFADIPANGRAGWKFAYKDANRDGNLEKMGVWQVAIHGEIILSMQINSVVIPRDGTYACGNVTKR